MLAIREQPMHPGPGPPFAPQLVRNLEPVGDRANATRVTRAALRPSVMGSRERLAFPPGVTRRPRQVEEPSGLGQWFTVVERDRVMHRRLLQRAGKRTRRVVGKRARIDRDRLPAPLEIDVQQVGLRRAVLETRRTAEE